MPKAYYRIAGKCALRWVQLETGLLEGGQHLIEVFEVVLHIGVGDQDVVEVRHHMLDWETTQYQLHE